MESRKRKRIVLEPSRKSEIVKYANEHPKASQQDVANYFSVLWDYPVNRRTVGDILARREKWQEADSTVKAARPPKEPQLEDALFMWFKNARAQNVILTDAILRVKAQQFGNDMGITNFTYSNGWLHRFKARHNISQHVLSGEGASVSPQVISDGREKAADVIKSYAPKDVFNMDETGLFFRMMPDRSLTTKDSVKGTKKMKDRITVSLCTNADGTEKEKPLVIGKSKNPRCFKNFHHELYVDYKNNQRSWMTGEIYVNWLKSFNSKMKLQNRHVLLLLDNAPTHVATQPLSNVKLHFLPPTTTSHLQPLDAGIIQAFKGHYRRHQLQHIVTSIDKSEDPSIPLNAAIRWVKNAWDCITPATIMNCWRHTGLVPRSDDSQSDDTHEADRLLPLINQVSTDAQLRMSPAEFVSVDNDVPTAESISDEDIISYVTSASETDATTDDDPDDIEPPPPPSTRDVNNAVDVLQRFIEHSRHSLPSDIDMHRALNERILALQTMSARQAKITDFMM